MPTGEHFIRIPDDTVVAVATSTEPTRIVAQRYGIHPRTVRKLRSGVMRKRLTRLAAERRTVALAMET